MKIYIAALAVAVISTAASAKPLTSEHWRAMCGGLGTGVDASIPHARCEARLLGEIDGVVVGMTLTRGGKPWVCMPSHVDAEVRRAVVERYLDKNPEALSEQFGEGVAAALAHAYPCHTR